MEGYITKGYSGFYYVSYQGRLIACSLKGKNRLRDIQFLPGDRVVFTETAPGVGVISDVLPRRNALARPSIANIDQAIIVVAAKDPAPDMNFIERLLVLITWSEIAPIICFNKVDLVRPEEQAALAAYFRSSGFPVYFVSSVTGEGVAELRTILHGKLSVLAGSSGVGKSSLLNMLYPTLSLPTGAISDKSRRGRHTTRHVELFMPEADTFVADTPGFSVLDMPKDLAREDLGRLYPDFFSRMGDCRFATCLHQSEPGCAIKEAVEAGEIPQGRYDNYLVFLAEVLAHERSYR